MSLVNSRPQSLNPSDVRALLSRHMLVDGFELVVDLEKSRGCRLYDALHHRYYIDFFSFFATHPIGFNHPHLWTGEAQKELLQAAVTKVSNADVYSISMARFVKTFARVAKPDFMKYLFWVEGGALAVENALKTAFDWKVRRNLRKGHREERGSQVIHFSQAFHGRSGYTLSLTNTYDVRKTAYFPKFNWPRVLNPKISFPLDERSLEEVTRAEEESVRQIKDAFAQNRDDIAAIIIEPIQGEGGDNHFRREFLEQLRLLADENEALLIFDEVQTGVGLTGRMWAYEHFVEPDIVAFGKKTQVCGIMSSDRIDDEPENVFHVPSRINSTWGGNLVDMVRCKLYLEAIESERLVSAAAVTGAYLHDQLVRLQAGFPHLISNARGRGLFCALDLPGNEMRARFREQCFRKGLIILPCGERSIRFRTALNIDRETLDEGLAVIREVLQGL
ncbi:MAG TPA: L-lysine 6-transaminase [Acidobacteriota bacterium]|jgi:L-lysine 6-transaminase